MQKVIVSDTSCLILFDKIGELNLLHKTFGTIQITKQVADEFNKNLPDWIQITNHKTALYQGLIAFLDIGEAASISLALEFEDCLLIIDEAKGRKVAKELGIEITGSLGILVTAKRNGFIKSVKPILKKIRETNFRMTDDLAEKVIRRAKEGIQ